MDYVTIGHVLGPAALGYYSLAYRICFMPYLSISAVANGALFPYYCRLPSQHAMARTAENAFSLINAISIPWLVGLVLFAGDIALLGGKWAPAAGAVRFLAVYAFFLSAILSNLQVLKARGRTDLVFLERGLHLAILTAVLIATVHLGITVVALDQAVVAAVIAVITGLGLFATLPCGCGGWAGPWACRCSPRSAWLPSSSWAASSPGCVPPLRGPRCSFLGRWPWASSQSPSWKIMPEPLRKGWTAIRGRPDDTTADRELPQLGVPGGSPPAGRGRCRGQGCRHDGGRRGRSGRHREVARPARSGRARRCRYPGFAAVSPQSRGRRAGGGLLLQCVSESRGRSRHGRQSHRRRRRDGLGPAVGGAKSAAGSSGRRKLWALAGFLLWTAVSIGVAVSEKTALQTSLRYLIFATLFFLVVQTVRGDRRQADVLIHVVVAAAAVASVIALVAFFSHHVVQASGPLKDPNDFGFILASTLPLAVYELRWGVGVGQGNCGALALALILVCTFATFSRSALTGLAIATLWAVLTRRLRLRWVLAAAACLAGGRWRCAAAHARGSSRLPFMNDATWPRRT